MECLWYNIYETSKQITSFCLNLVYSSPDEVLDKLLGYFDDYKKNTETIYIFLKYISIPETLKKLLKSEKTQ